jgi:hypothetical protein
MERNLEAMTSTCAARRVAHVVGRGGDALDGRRVDDEIGEVDKGANMF